MTEKLPVIQIQDLHKSYDSLDILKGVGLLAYEGSVVSLIGASGSGKSTLLRCANLLENSQSGDILFCGDAVRWTGTGTSRRPSDKQKVQQMLSQLSMVFQQFNLWSHMTVLQNVTEAPVTVLQEAPQIVKASARDLLEKVGILVTVLIVCAFGRVNRRLNRHLPDGQPPKRAKFQFIR
jgi:polar amino acid transport system ATP-binding protein